MEAGRRQSELGRSVDDVFNWFTRVDPSRKDGMSRAIYQPSHTVDACIYMTIYYLYPHVLDGWGNVKNVVTTIPHCTELNWLWVSLVSNELLQRPNERQLLPVVTRIDSLFSTGTRDGFPACLPVSLESWENCDIQSAYSRLNCQAQRPRPIIGVL